MARYIHCSTCKDRMEASAKKYSELYESLEGEAINQLKCDGCGENIHPNQTTFASVLLPDRYHHGYATQKPSEWANQYLKLKPDGV